MVHREGVDRVIIVSLINNVASALLSAMLPGPDSTFITNVYDGICSHDHRHWHVIAWGNCQGKGGRGSFKLAADIPPSRLGAL